MDQERPGGEALDQTIEAAEAALERIRTVRRHLGEKAVEELATEDRVALRVAVTSLMRAAKEVQALSELRPPVSEVVLPPEVMVLYQKIVEPPERMRQPRGGGDIVEVEIIDDTTVMIHGWRIELTPELIYVLNQMLMAERPLMTSRFVERMQASGETREDAQERVRALLVLFISRMGEDVVGRNKVGGPGWTYRWRPGAIVTDRRLEPETEAEAEVKVAAEVEEHVAEVTSEPVDESAAETAETEVETAVTTTPVLKRGERNEDALLEGQWGDAGHIAELTGLPLAMVQAFIERNRSKIGTYFVASEMRSKPVPGSRVAKTTEHFSPKFIEWAVASLDEAWRRYEAAHPSSE